MTHCNNSTTAPSFDCIKYTPNNPTIMIRPPHMVKKGTGGKRYDLDNHYEPTVLTNEHTKKTIKNYVKQKVERKIAQTIVDSVLYGQTPSQTKNNKELQAISLSCKRLTLERKIAQTIRDSVLYGQTPTQNY